jgi:hypothetical protein
METDGLVIGTIAETFPVANKKFGVEAPTNNGSRDNIIITIYICALRDVEELFSSSIVARSA